MLLSKTIFLIWQWLIVLADWSSITKKRHLASVLCQNLLKREKNSASLITLLFCIYLSTHGVCLTTVLNQWIAVVINTVSEICNILFLSRKRFWQNSKYCNGHNEAFIARSHMVSFRITRLNVFLLSVLSFIFFWPRF